MKCEKCRFYNVFAQNGDECPFAAEYGTVFKDGSDGCTKTYNTLAKEERKQVEYLGYCGCCMGVEKTFKDRGIDIKSVISKCEHMVGFTPKAVYHRHGRAYYKAYRNGWCGYEEAFEVMSSEAIGFMTKRTSDKYTYYHLTDLGLRWLSNQVHVSINRRN